MKVIGVEGDFSRMAFTNVFFCPKIVLLHLIDIFINTHSFRIEVDLNDLVGARGLKITSCKCNVQLKDTVEFNYNRTKTWRLFE